MPCESCAIQFSVFKRKRACSECERLYCSGCLRRGGGSMCAPCRLLSTRPLYRQNIASLKVRDLQCFLQRQNVSTRGCVEKDELVSLCVSHVNSSSYRRRGGRGAGAFSSLKGFTNNINEFINSAFETRNNQPTNTTQQEQPYTCKNGSCFNASHVHTPPPRTAAPEPTTRQPQPTRPERFTTTPGGERDLFVPVPPPPPLSPEDTPRVPLDTADCFEIEDLDDSGWEFVTRPADPLPNDSDVLLSSTEGSAGRPRASPPPSPPPPEEPRPARPARPPPPEQRSHSDGEEDESPRDTAPEFITTEEEGMGGRAASELELRAPATEEGTPGGLVRLEQITTEEQLEALSVRQLKALLVRGCVAYRGCVERAELVELARRLWRAREPPDADTCRICMAAPLDTVLLECGHVVACATCARRLPECPLCRAYVVRAVRIFRS